MLSNTFYAQLIIKQSPVACRLNYGFLSLYFPIAYRLLVYRCSFVAYLAVLDRLLSSAAGTFSLLFPPFLYA